MIEKVLIKQNFPLLVKGIENICWNGGCNDDECPFYKNKNVYSLFIQLSGDKNE